MFRMLAVSAMYLIASFGSVPEESRYEDVIKPPHTPKRALESLNVTGVAVRVASPSLASTPVTVPPQPTSYGDERREPIPRRVEVPVYRQSRSDWRCDEWMPMALDVGWPEEELAKLNYVIFRESRCDPDAFNPDDPMGGSAGLSQINYFWAKPSKYWPDGWLQTHGVLVHRDELFDPETNLRAALAMWHNSGWSPWGM